MDCGYLRSFLERVIAVLGTVYQTVPSSIGSPLQKLQKLRKAPVSRSDAPFPTALLCSLSLLFPSSKDTPVFRGCQGVSRGTLMVFLSGKKGAAPLVRWKDAISITENP